MTFNPFLRPWVAHQPNSQAGHGLIQQPGEVPNVVWQTRSFEPTSYEVSLGDALEIVFDQGAAELSTLTAGLNRLGVRTPDGEVWNEERLAEQLRLLAQ